MNQQLKAFSDLFDKRLTYQQDVEQDKQWKRDVQQILNTLRQERFQMTRGFYLMALLKFCSDIRYRDLFPTRQIWIQDLSAVEAKNFFRDVDYEINRQEKAFDIADLNDMINDSVQETAVKDDEEETLEDKIQNLEFQLQTTRSTLKFVQRSFDDMVANINARSARSQGRSGNEFFIRLNSERYGRLLDSAFLVETKMELLRKEKCRFHASGPLCRLLRTLRISSKPMASGLLMREGDFEASADHLLYIVYEGEPFLGDEGPSDQSGMDER